MASKSTQQRGPMTNQHKRLAMGEDVGKRGVGDNGKAAPKLQKKSNPKGK